MLAAVSGQHGVEQLHRRYIGHFAFAGVWLCRRLRGAMNKTISSLDFRGVKGKPSPGGLPTSVQLPGEYLFTGGTSPAFACRRPATC